MMGGSDGSAVAGGLVPHVPVLGRRAAEYLNLRHDGRYIDATFGSGGYSRALLGASRQVWGLDRDPAAIALGAALVESAKGRLTLIEDTFSNLADAAGGEGVDGVVFDLGVSSMQLDNAERGFSFRHDGPLDMRMSRRGVSAADLVAKASEKSLAAIIATLGEERHARAVARAIVRAREKAPIRTTAALAEIVAAAVRGRPGDIHPATRTFQALRIFINDELGELARGLAAAERVLKPDGRLVVVSFHSLEDRIVKTFLTERSATGGGSRHRPEVRRASPSFAVLTKRPVTPDEAEIAQNPRARSAKLRAAERTTAPPPATMPDLLPRLPSLADVIKGS